ncbi:MAG TPA: cation diffusion facilitator family transporter [Gemmatimonadales bacterium]
MTFGSNTGGGGFRRGGAPVVASVDCTHLSGGLSRHSRALRLALAITLIFMIAEAVGGWLANSLALLADAGHMLGDAASIGLALTMAWVAQRPVTPEKTYGYLRLEILAAVVNGVALFLIAGLIVWQAVGRFSQPPEVRSGLMLGVAVAGLVANLGAMRVLHAGHAHSLNLRGAYLHVLSDLLGSLGAILAAVIIALTGWMPADPIISIVIAILVLGSAWRLLRESVDVLLEATPHHISLRDVQDRIATIPGVSDVHDLHVWTVTSGVIAMTGHAVVEDPARSQGVLETLAQRMEALGIHHVTMQLEEERMCGDAVAQ